MKIEILRGYRGKATQEAYIAPGIQDVDPALAAYLVGNGHAIAATKQTAPPPVEVAEVEQPEPTDGDNQSGLHGLTVAELRQYASDYDISLGNATRKDDIIAVIEDAISGD